MTQTKKQNYRNTSSREKIELQDLGGGHYRGVYKDRSILLDEREGKLETTLGQVASWAVMDRKTGPAKLAEIAGGAIRDGLVDASDIPEFLTEEPGKNRKPYKDWAITRKAALLLMTRCRTPRAIELTRAMADVFEEWLDRRDHLHQSMGIEIVAELRRTIAGQREENQLALVDLEKKNQELEMKIAALSMRADNDYGYVSDAWVKEHISDPLWKLARYMHAADVEKTISGKRTKSDPKEKTLRGHHRALSNKLRNLIGHNGPGSNWKKLQRIPALMQFVDNWIREQLQTAMKEATQEVLLKVAEEMANQKAARSGQMILQMASYKQKAKK